MFKTISPRSHASSWKKVSVSVLAAMIVVVSLVLPPSAVSAAPTLTVTPITWNVIGLDSNNVNVGPNNFPVGVRVCNTGDAATNLTATFYWDSASAYINTRPGTTQTLHLTNLAGGTLQNPTCTDFYYEVEVTRNAAAYDTKRQYHVTVTADSNISVSTPTPRELYVEHLISQSRNSVMDMQLSTDGGSSYASYPNGSTMSLVVGQTYFIKLVGKTATNGYEQIESFINFPNTIFQILSVKTTYTAESSSSLVPDEDLPDQIDDKYYELYGDGCVWENDPNSPNYRSCLSTGKAGGDISVTYQIKILAVPSTNPEPLSTLIYDFSGSSYHYNADFGASVRFANIVSATLAKAFSPKTIVSNGISKLIFTIYNPGTSPIAGVHFSDTFPTGVKVSFSPSISYSGCNFSSTPSPSTLSANETSLSISDVSVAALGTCTITVDSVTASTVQSYVNTTNHLFVDTLDTGSYGSDTLTVVDTTTPPKPSSCTNPATLVTWNFNATDSGTPNTDTTPIYSSKALNVSSAVATATGGTPSRPATTGSTSGANVWTITGGWEMILSTPTHNTTPYFQFAVDTSNYSNVEIRLSHDLEATGSWASAGTNNQVYVHTSPDGGSSWTDMPATGIVSKKGQWNAYNSANGVDVTATNTGINMTTFRINAIGAAKPAALVNLDDVTILGCPRPAPPQLAKAFSPTSIPTSPSTLTFTVINPNSSTLTGVGFTDALPAGLVINTPNGVTGPTCTGGTISGQDHHGCRRHLNHQPEWRDSYSYWTERLLHFFGERHGQRAGLYHNVTSNITSTETGPNTTGGPNVGYGVADLTVTVVPPVISKAFGASSYSDTAPGNTTSLTFGIYNPNPGTTLTGVAFNDVLPAGLTVATATTNNVCNGTGTLTATNPSTVSLSGASLAPGASCTFSVNVTGTTTGLKNNSVTVTSTNAGTGNTATASLLVKALTPAISILKQVGTSNIGPWFTSIGVPVGTPLWYRFTVENTGDAALALVNVTDPILTGLDVSLVACTWANMPLYDVQTCVVGSITSVSGSHPNTATADGTYGGTHYTDTSKATYNTTGLTLAKSVAESSYSVVGNVLHYSYVVTNNGFASLAGPVTVYDDISTDETCPNVNTVGDLDAFLDRDESITCTATYSVKLGDVGTGQSVTNSAWASTTTDGQTVKSNTDSKTVYCTPPLAVDLATFTATPAPDGVTLAWETVSEQDSAGFNLYRAAEAGSWAQLNAALIPSAAPGSGEGQRYEWLDTTAGPDAPCADYRLDAVDRNGTVTVLGTTSAACIPPKRTWLPLVMR